MKKRGCQVSFLALLTIIIMVFSSCLWEAQIPESGSYYCEEIGTQIDFGSGEFLEMNNKEEFGHIDNDRGSSCFMLWCENKDSENFGNALYTFDCIWYSDEKMLVRDRESGTQYIFVRC